VLFRSITNEDGDVITLTNNKNNKPSETVTEQDALRDLNRRLKNEFIPATMKSIGNVSLPNNVTAALVSVVYNYGHLPSSVKSAIQETPLSIQKIANAVGSLSSNKQRRQEEAAYILKSDNTSASQDNIQAKSGGKLTVTSHYGNRRSGMHYGTDYGLSTGTTIYILKPGVVTRADNRDSNGYGNLIEIEHEDGSKTRYAHMSKMNVSDGDVVPAGTLIGLSGGGAGEPGAGNSRGEHLHWEYIPAGESVGVNGESYATSYFSLSKPSIKTPSDSETKSTNIFNMLANIFK
jgi:murein DD-endopeptidase MepM/ murein hydrolase activator NlpD